MWTLVVLFGFLAAIHVVLTVLFYTGVWDQGVGYIFSLEWPSWLITLADAAAAALLWLGYKRSATAPVVGFALTFGASIIVWGRTSWMVFVPVLMLIAIACSVGRIVSAGRSA